VNKFKTQLQQQLRDGIFKTERKKVAVETLEMESASSRNSGEQRGLVEGQGDTGKCSALSLTVIP
jgi:hypothetical protein